MSAKISNKNLHVVFLFLDGIGIGEKDPDSNPLFRAKIPTLAALCGGEFPNIPFNNLSSDLAGVIALDATLGIPGLPQSGTNQTTIFTGIDGAKKFGRHFGPHPPSILRPIIEEKNIFTQLKAIGKSAVFTNIFPHQFFDYIKSGSKRLTVTTLSCISANVPLLTEKAFENNTGISSDITRARWREIGYLDIKPIAPVEAGKHLALIASRYNFTLFEYWLTDHAGHSQKMSEAVEVLEKFDEFLSGFLKLFNPNNTLLIILSDHGNIEDITTKTHTRNKVPCILTGKYKSRLVKEIKKLTHITPAIVSLFNEP